MDSECRWTQGADQDVTSGDERFYIDNDGLLTYSTAALSTRYTSTVTGRATARCNTDLGSTDHYALAVIGPSTGANRAVAACARFAADNTFYMLQATPSDVRLFRCVGGTFTALGSSVSYTWTEGDVIEIRCVGDTIRGYINGVRIQSVTDATISTGTKAGLHARQASGASYVQVSRWEAGTLTEGFDRATVAVQPPAPRIDWTRVGAVTSTTATIKARALNVTRARLVTSSSSELTSPAVTDWQTPSDGLVAFDLTGLTAEATTHFAVEYESDGGNDTDTDTQGQFTTFPTEGAQASFTVAASGDSGSVSNNHGYVGLTRTSNAPTFSRILDRDPAAFLWLGDRAYRDPTSEEDSARLHREVLLNPLCAELLRNVPTVETWDDHDYAGSGDGDIDSTGRLGALAAYRDHVPHYPLADGDADTAIGQTFVIGRVRFILCDGRSQRDPDAVPPTMLGAEQKQWLTDTIDAATEPLIVLYVNVPWIATTDDDTWSGYSTERTELADHFVDNDQMDRLFIIHADAHMLAYDDGTNNTYDTGATTGCPVLCAAPLDSTASQKGGTYSGGKLPSSGGAAVQQYVTLDFTDAGSTITVDVTGWRLDGGGATEQSVLTAQHVVSAT